MAYVYKKEDDAQNQNDSQLASAPVDSGASQATGGAAPTKSGSWVNLNQYLKNQPQIQQTAQKLVGEPIAKSTEAQNAIISAQSKLEKATPANVSEQQKTLMESALNTPSVVNQSGAKQAYQDITKAYTGPTKVDTASYSPAYEEAKRINESKQKSIQEQLQQQYTDNYSTGKQALDIFALRNDANSAGLIENAKAEAIKRQQALDSLLAKNSGIEQNIQTILKNRQAYANDIANRAKQNYETLQKGIEAKYDLNAPKIQQQLANDVNLIKNFKEITPAQAKALGINADLYNASMKQKATSEGWYQSKPGYDANQIKLGEMNRATSDATRYLMGNNPQEYSDVLDKSFMHGQNSPQYKEAVSNLVKATGKSEADVLNTVKQIWDISALPVGYARNPQTAPDVSNRPQYGDYITTTALPTDRNAFATANEINSENALNNIFGLGNTQKTVPNSANYGAKIDEAKYYNDLINYLNKTLKK